MAQKYRKVDPRIWNDENFIRLTVEGKLLALWMLAGNRVNRCGIVLWSPGLASEETGISRDRIDTVCHTVCDTLNWSADMAARTVFLTRWWRYNPPDNKSALEGALKDLHDIPKNNLKEHLLRASEDISHGVRHLYVDAVHTVYPTVGVTVSPQKQEQEQKQKQEDYPSGSVPPPPVAAPAKIEPKPKADAPIPDTVHHQSIAAFCDAWQTRYGEKYPFNGGKDGETIRKILKHTGEDLEKFRLVVSRYFGTDDEFVLKSRHSLGLFQSQLARWLVDPVRVAKPPPPPAETDVEKLKRLARGMNLRPTGE